MIDLHIHSILSDGTDLVKDLITKVKDNNIKIFSITDHDNIEAAKIINTDYRYYIEKMGLKYINGIEFSVGYNDNSMHILVYGYSVDDVFVNEYVNIIKNLRLDRIKKRIMALKNDFDIVLTNKELDWLFSQNNPSKPHIANILVDRGLATSISGAINKYLFHKFPETKINAIDLVKGLSKRNLQIGIAHGLGGVNEKRISYEEFENNVKVMKEAGITFLECYYSLYNEEEREFIRKIADKYNLKLSGGSDYHGLNKDVKLGNLGNDYNPCLEDLSILDNGIITVG